MKTRYIAVYEGPVGRWEVWVDDMGTRYADYCCAHTGFVMPVPDQEPDEVGSFCDPEVATEECRRCPFFPLPDLEDPNWRIIGWEEAVRRYWAPEPDETAVEYRLFTEVVYQDTGNRARRTAMLTHGLGMFDQEVQC